MSRYFNCFIARPDLQSGRILLPICNRLFVLTGFLLIICSCKNTPDKIGNLDLLQWRSDRGGCNGKRQTQLVDFKAIEPKLLSEHINEVGVWLGRPDIHQLGRRDEKFYVYFLEKGIHCTDIKKPSAAQKVILRFNSVGLLSEITYQQEAL